MPKARQCTLNERTLCEELLADPERDRDRAYLKAYPRSEKWSRRLRQQKCYETLTRPAVRAYLQQLLAPVIAEARCSFQDHLEALATIRDLALATGSFHAAVRAEHMRGLASDHYPRRGGDGPPAPPHGGPDEVGGEPGIARLPYKPASEEEWRQQFTPPREVIEGHVEPDAEEGECQ